MITMKGKQFLGFPFDSSALPPSPSNFFSFLSLHPFQPSLFPLLFSFEREKAESRKDFILSATQLKIH